MASSSSNPKDSKADPKTINQTSAAPADKNKPTALEEDDEFEDFPVDDWSEDQTEAGTATGTQHLWEESWDDDDTSDDFSKQLKEELKKVDASKRK